MVNERKKKEVKLHEHIPPPAPLKHQVRAFTTEAPKLGGFQRLEPQTLQLARK